MCSSKSPSSRTSLTSSTGNCSCCSPSSSSPSSTSSSPSASSSSLSTSPPHCSVHVESMGEPVLRGRAGRHCGQKRTYRAVRSHICLCICLFQSFQVADQYAFIPREAVSRFLLHCTECQRKPAGMVNNFDIKSELSSEPSEFETKPTTPQLATPPATPPSEATAYNSLPYMLPPHGPIGPHAALAYAQVKSWWQCSFCQILILWKITVFSTCPLQAINAMQSFAARALYPAHTSLPDSGLLFFIEVWSGGVSLGSLGNLGERKVF